MLLPPPSSSPRPATEMRPSLFTSTERPEITQGWPPGGTPWTMAFGWLPMPPSNRAMELSARTVAGSVRARQAMAVRNMGILWRGFRVSLPIKHGSPCYYSAALFRPAKGPPAARNPMPDSMQKPVLDGREADPALVREIAGLVVTALNLET